jgi:hypothetical protein
MFCDYKEYEGREEVQARLQGETGSLVVYTPRRCQGALEAIPNLDEFMEPT